MDDKQLIITVMILNAWLLIVTYTVTLIHEAKTVPTKISCSDIGIDRPDIKDMRSANLVCEYHGLFQGYKNMDFNNYNPWLPIYNNKTMEHGHFGNCVWKDSKCIKRINNERKVNNE